MSGHRLIKKKKRKNHFIGFQVLVRKSGCSKIIKIFYSSD